MASVKFTNVGIRAIAACVPEREEKVASLSDLMSQKEIEVFTNGTGIKSRRIASAETCTSDLCFAAAEKLFAETGIERDSVDAVIFVSKTGDYIIPATSALLQHRLGISKNALCLDVRLACSGYVYALSAAYAYASAAGIDRVLLLAGDTNSKIVSKKDKSEYPVFGDGGSATLIEKGDFSPAFFNLGTDGGRGEAVIIPSENGGRNAISAESLLYCADESGNERNALQMHMKGADVFSFAISTVPKSIKSLSDFAETPLEQIEAFFIHQANQFILQTIAKKLKISAQKIPVNLDRFGNTSSASIPLLFSSEFGGSEYSGKALLCGFGSGLSWASMIQDLKAVQCCELFTTGGGAFNK